MFNINGENWKVFLVSANHPALIRSNNSLSIGACDDNLKSIYILESLNDKYLKRVLCHEITHACMFSYNIDLTFEQEEMFADLIATYGSQIIYISNLLFNRLKEIKKQGT